MKKKLKRRCYFSGEKIIKSLAGPADVWNWAIENIWNVMKMRLKDMRPRSRIKATMRNAMIGIWDELEDDLRENLI